MWKVYPDIQGILLAICYVVMIARFLFFAIQ